MDRKTERTERGLKARIEQHVVVILVGVVAATAAALIAITAQVKSWAVEAIDSKEGAAAIDGAVSRHLARPEGKQSVVAALRGDEVAIKALATDVQPLVHARLAADIEEKLRAELSGDPRFVKSVAVSILSSEEMKRRIIDAVVPPDAAPVGAVVAFAGDLESLPIGWAYCNGAKVGSIEGRPDGKQFGRFHELYAAIGITHGGVSETEFRLPDYRGYFLRGVADGVSGRDPDSATRQAMAAGGASGDRVGSVQADAIREHGHDIPVFSACHPRDTGPLMNVKQGHPPCQGKETHSLTGPTHRLEGHKSEQENRPKNVAVRFLIKYCERNCSDQLPDVAGDLVVGRAQRTASK